METTHKLIKVISFVQMSKFFSHFGVRALLVLYMVETLKFGDIQAFSINALFCALVELSALFGGWVADRFLGLKKSVLFGSIILLLGFFSLLFAKGFFLSLTLIVLGSSLFSSNIIALLGRALDEDKRREGFISFYMMQNIGALCSVLISSWIASSFGFQMGFLAASIGMLLSVIVLFWNFALLNTLQEEKKPCSVLKVIGLFLGLGAAALLGFHYQTIALPLLPFLILGCISMCLVKLLSCKEISKVRIKKLSVYLGALILFFAAEDQMFSSLMVFSEREVNRELFGVIIPSGFIMAMNPIIIFAFGNMISRIKVKLIYPFLLIGGGFLLLSLLVFLQVGISLLSIAMIVVSISIGELMLGPLIYDFASKTGGEKRGGFVMGIVSLGFSVAYLVSGYFSQMTSYIQAAHAKDAYGFSFLLIALLMLMGGFILQFLDRDEFRVLESRG
ncbi:MAG: oligopeptide:H+ symporter [Chlamydiae bacterium]|nr:oligopeptide:H+ symporter [Chlamydiota bacterium]